MVNTFPAGHFYSPIPNVDELDSVQFINRFANILALDDAAVFQFAEKIFAYAQELSGKIDSEVTDFRWENDQFPPADALAYYGVLRALKPNKVLEIGAGYSTQVAFSALNENGSGSITCIEPYPRPFLEQATAIKLVKQPLQSVPDELFKSLTAGDVLFIDSSHQVKCQSDVLDIFFRVLDLVEPGVYIHFHDIFYPDDYPEFWLKENGIFFNEQYFLQAFLKDNPKYLCILPNAYLVRKHQLRYRGWVKEVHRPLDSHFVNNKHGFIKAGSFWLLKQRG